MTLFADDPNRNWAEPLIEGDVHHIPDELDETGLPEPERQEYETDEDDEEIDITIARQLAIDA